jgi:hypothetical protein
MSMQYAAFLRKSSDHESLWGAGRYGGTLAEHRAVDPNIRERAAAKPGPARRTDVAPHPLVADVLAAGLDEGALVREDDDLRPVAQAQLGEDAGDV